MYNSFFKRFVDFFIAFFLLILFFPILIIMILFLYLTHKSGVFFFQERPGKHCKIFKVVKFKTMNDKRDANGCLLSDAERLTGIGRFLRTTSLDELPQLINVLKGDMALIGPRPLLIRYLPYYTEEEQIRHSVRPGITGWAQVNGRNILSWDERLKKDVWYVRNMSFKLDIKIVFLTIKRIIKKEDIIVDPHSIMLNLDEERRDRLSN